MVVCHEHKFVFIEIPHTGSHSITNELLEHFDCVRILRKHANISQFFGQCSAEERSYFKFAAVRNPLDTAVTDYCKLEGNHKGQYTNPDALLSNGGHVTDAHIEQFNFIRENGASFSDFMHRYRNKIYHNWFLLGADRMDFIIRFENLQQDYETALSKIGLSLPRSLPHVNPTKKKKRHYLEYYTPEVRRLIVRCYGPYMRQWSYPFPDDWKETQVPLSSILKFKLLEGLVGQAAKFMTLDPDSKLVSNIKNISDALRI